MKKIINKVLEKLEHSEYIDPAEHICDAIKTIKRHIDNEDLNYYIKDFVWGLESPTVIDVDGVVKECSKLLHKYLKLKPCLELKK